MADKNKKYSKRKGQILHRTFEISEDTIRALNEDTREIDVIFSTEDAEVRRWFGFETLGHGKSEVRLERLNQGGAVLVGHNHSEQIGVTEIAKIDTGSKQGLATLRFGKSAKAEEIFQDVKDRIRRFVSVGYQVYKTVLERVENDIEYHRVVDWEPVEISIVPVPADPNAEILRSEESAEFETLIETRSIPMNDKQKRAFLIQESATRALTDDERAFLASDKGLDARAEPAPKVEPADTKKIRENELNRIREITAIGESLNMAEDAKRFINDDKSVADMNEFAVEAMKKRGFKPATPAADSDLGLNKTETKRFSILRALDAMAHPQDRKAQEAAAFEMECSNAVAEQRGISSQGFFVPERGENGFVDSSAKGSHVRGLSVPGEIQRRDLSAGTPTDGAELVAEDLLSGSFIDVLRNASALANVGATMLPGLVGDVAIPRKTSGSVAGWISTEGGNASQSDPQFDQVTLSPKTAGVYSEVTRQLLKQSSISVENLLRNDLATGMALLIDAAGLYGTGASGQPQGIETATGVNTPTAFVAAVPTYPEVVAMESAVAADNALAGTMAYILETAMRGSLKTAEKFSSTGQTIWEPGNTLNGYGTSVSNQVTSGDIFFGNWADMLVGMWGGLDLLIDPYTNSLSGTIRIVAHQSVDLGLRHGESFCFNNDT